MSAPAKRLADARTRLDAASAALRGRHQGNELGEFRAAYDELLAAERAVAASRDEEHVRVGPPNDEVIHGHPLHGRGLSAYKAHEVIRSRWVQDLQTINSVHHLYDPARWKTGTAISSRSTTRPSSAWQAASPRRFA